MLKLRTKSDATYEVIVEGAKFTVKPMNNDELSRLRKRHTAVKRGREELDVDSMYYERFDKTVIEWEGIGDENGKPIPCTPENKRMVANLNQEIALEVLRLADNIGGDAREAAEKN
jgi:hypothetical protein